MNRAFLAIILGAAIVAVNCKHTGHRTLTGWKRDAKGYTCTIDEDCKYYSKAIRNKSRDEMAKECESQPRCHSFMYHSGGSFGYLCDATHSRGMVTASWEFCPFPAAAVGKGKAAAAAVGKGKAAAKIATTTDAKNTPASGITIDDYVGTWTIQHEKVEAVCHRVSTIAILCVIPVLGNQTFTIDGATIKLVGGAISGTYSDNGSITWTTGNRWVKLVCVPYTKEACRAAGEKWGQQLVESNEGNYGTKGCYSYLDMMFTPRDVYYGTGGSIVEKSEPINDTIRYRPVGYDCAEDNGEDDAFCQFLTNDHCDHEDIKEHCPKLCSNEEEITTTTEPPCPDQDVEAYCVHMYEFAASICNGAKIMKDCARMCCLSKKLGN